MTETTPTPGMVTTAATWVIDLAKGMIPYIGQCLVLVMTALVAWFGAKYTTSAPKPAPTPIVLELSATNARLDAISAELKALGAQLRVEPKIETPAIKEPVRRRARSKVEGNGWMGGSIGLGK